MPQAKGLQFTVRVGQLPDDHFAVVGFSVHEGLSELFEGVVELASTDAAVAAGDVLEQPI
ncbi:hypothetical protein C8D92_103358, partial [Tamilnaduibacter salinus]